MITADIVVPQAGAEGVVLAQGGEIGGWSLYVKNEAPRGSPTTFSVERTYKSLARHPSGPGRIIVSFRFEFAFDGGGPGAGGNRSIFRRRCKKSPAAGSSTLTRTR